MFDAFSPAVPGAAAGLHEMLLQSEHRTLDPEEADYFYIPVRMDSRKKERKNTPVGVD